MPAVQVEEMIYEWLNAHYPDGPVWFDGDVPAGGLPPLELRMLYAFNVIEYNISNGGWSQFLWNCFSNWRALLDTAQQGYYLIGAVEQARALDTMRALCEQDEQECLGALQREDGSMDMFAEFTRRSYGNVDNDWESLFWGDIYEKRQAWLAANEGRIRSLIERLDA
jgi:hypothetical protein